MTARALATLGMAALVLASGARIAAEPSATARLDWLFDGNVLATTRIGNVIYVGGTFRNVSPTSGALGHLFALSTSTGAAVPGLPIVNGAVKGPVNALMMLEQQARFIEHSTLAGKF